MVNLLPLEHPTAANLMRREPHLIDPFINGLIADAQIRAYLINSNPPILHRNRPFQLCAITNRYHILSIGGAQNRPSIVGVPNWGHIHREILSPDRMAKHFNCEDELFSLIFEVSLGRQEYLMAKLLDPNVTLTRISICFFLKSSTFYRIVPD